MRPSDKGVNPATIDGEEVLYEWDDGDSCLVENEDECLIVRQLGRDGHWYDIDYIENYSPFIDLIKELLEAQDA